MPAAKRAPSERVYVLTRSFLLELCETYSGEAMPRSDAAASCRSASSRTTPTPRRQRARDCGSTEAREPCCGAALIPVHARSRASRDRHSTCSEARHGIQLFYEFTQRQRRQWCLFVHRHVDTTVAPRPRKDCRRPAADATRGNNRARAIRLIENNVRRRHSRWCFRYLT